MTMLIHDIPDSKLDIPSQLELREERRRNSRKASRASKRRNSIQAPLRPNKDPSVYNVLLHILFSLSSFTEDMRLDDAFAAITSHTSRRRQKLSERDILELDEAFNVVHHALDHVFLPFTTHADMRGSALATLDIGFVCDIILSLERIHLHEIPFKEREEWRAPTKTLFEMVGFDRRMTI